MKQSFLMLQGPGSLFFTVLGRMILREGHDVLRVNFCGGDIIFSLGLPSVNYRGQQDELRPFIDDLLIKRNVTDLVLFGDCRPLHRIAMGAAKAHGVRIHVFEEGYIRPDWITLERDGVNGYSTLQLDPEHYRATAKRLPDTPYRKVPGGFKRRVFYDILYYVANGLCYPFFHRFQTHRLCPMPFEYMGWIRRILLRILNREERRAVRCSQQLLADNEHYYIFPLQLDTDFQIRTHSRFGRLNPAIEHVLDSFAAHAPAGSILVVKNHPLDNGMVNLRRFVEQQAERRGVRDRVRYIDGGHLPTLLSGTRGVVVVNSTVGFSALIHSKPVKALGLAFYDMLGLTFQGSLDEFWNTEQGPDRSLVHAVRKVVLETTQINGNLFTQRGMATAMPLAVERLTHPEGS